MYRHTQQRYINMRCDYRSLLTRYPESAVWPISPTSTFYSILYSSLYTRSLLSDFGSLIPILHSLKLGLQMLAQCLVLRILRPLAFLTFSSLFLGDFNKGPVRSVALELHATFICDHSYSSSNFKQANSADSAVEPTYFLRVLVSRLVHA